MPENNNSIKVFFTQPAFLSAACIAFGVLYIPAFIHGYFWLWVFPFIALTTLYLRALLDGALESVSNIEDEGKRSWAMSFKLFGVNMIQVVICAFPFILAHLLYMQGAIQTQNVSTTDQWFYNFAFGVFPEKQLTNEVNYSDGTVQILLACVFFSISSLLSFSILGFRKSVAARRVIFNAKKEPTDDPAHDARGNPLNCLELGVSAVLFLLFWESGIGILNEPTISYVSFLSILYGVAFTVFSSIYVISCFFVVGNKIKR